MTKRDCKINICMFICICIDDDELRLSHYNLCNKSKRGSFKVCDTKVFKLICNNDIASFRTLNIFDESQGDTS